MNVLRSEVIEGEEDVQFCFHLTEVELTTINGETIMLEDQDWIVYDENTEAEEINFTIRKNQTIEEVLKSRVEKIRGRGHTEKTVLFETPIKEFHCSLPREEFEEKILGKKKKAHLGEVVKNNRFWFNSKKCVAGKLNFSVEERKNKFNFSLFFQPSM